MPPTDTELVRRLLREQVPEVAVGRVEIVAVSREAGKRTKVAVRSRDPAIDAVGACVGEKGLRIQAVAAGLGSEDESIDLIPWSEDPVRFACDSLAPIEIRKVYVDDDAHSMEFVIAVPVDPEVVQHLRLASQLTGWTFHILPPEP